MGTGLNPLGEKQVNFSTNGSSGGVVGTQADPAVTALSNGDFVVVYENPHSGDSLLAHFFDASGNAIGPPVSSGLLNGVVGIDPAAQVGVQPAIAATPDGGFLVAYTDTSVTYTNPATLSLSRSTTSLFAATTTRRGSALPSSSTAEARAVHQPNAGHGRRRGHRDICGWDQPGCVGIRLRRPGRTEDDVYFAFLNSSAADSPRSIGGPRTLDDSQRLPGRGQGRNLGQSRRNRLRLRSGARSTATRILCSTWSIPRGRR